jgi:cardiolipin synthase
MNMKILVDSGEFWPQLAADIDAAKKSVYIQAMTFEADRAGRSIGEALLAARAEDKRALIDTVSQYVVSDRFVYGPRQWFDRDLRKERRDTRQMISELRRRGVQLKITNPYGPLWVRFPARNHKKLMVIDGRIAYIGGINFSDHNFSWHDMMIRIEDRSAAAFLEEDFLYTWRGGNQFATEAFKDLQIWVGDGRRNSRMFDSVREIVRVARSRIFIESTYFTLPFFGWLREIRRRPRPSITLLTSRVNNWPQMRRYIPWEAERSAVNLRVYPGRLTHLKAILVDDHSLIMGSSNFEFFSYHLYQEIVAVIRDPRVIAEFRERVMIPDLEKSLPFEGRIHHLRAAARALEFRIIGGLSRRLTYL